MVNLRIESRIERRRSLESDFLTWSLLGHLTGLVWLEIIIFPIHSFLVRIYETFFNCEVCLFPFFMLWSSFKFYRYRICLLLPYVRINSFWFILLNTMEAWSLDIHSIGGITIVRPSPSVLEHLIINNIWIKHKNEP